MLLTRLRLVNYRCYDDVTFDQLDRLAVFVGENDVGKTRLLDAVACLVGSGICASEDYRSVAKDHRAAEVMLEGTFRLEAHDTLPPEYRAQDATAGGEELRVAKHFSKTGSKVRCWGLGYSDERFNSFKGADRQKDLLKAYGRRAASREEERLVQLNQLRAELIADEKLTATGREVELPSFGALADHMPASSGSPPRISARQKRWSTASCATWRRAS